MTARDGVIRPHNLPADVNRRPDVKHPFQVDLTRSLPDQLTELTAAFEERYIRKALRKTRGHVGQVRQAQRPVAPEHHRQDRPLQDRQGDIQEGRGVGRTGARGSASRGTDATWAFSSALALPRTPFG